MDVIDVITSDYDLESSIGHICYILSTTLWTVKQRKFDCLEQSKAALMETINEFYEALNKMNQKHDEQDDIIKLIKKNWRSNKLVEIIEVDENE
jgi:hypothetical protein